MNTSAADPWASARRLKPEDFKGTPAPALEGKAVKLFLAHISDCVDHVLAELNPIKARCSLISTRQAARSNEEPAQTCLRFDIGGSGLRVWPSGDRDLELLLCELVFGGCGIEAGEDEQERPATKVEQRVSKLVLRQAGSALAQLAAQMTDKVQSEVTDEDEADQDAESDESVDVIELKLLVTAFNLSGEMTIALPVADLQTVFRTDDPAARPEATAFDVLGECSFALDALLPSEQQPLDLILAIKPGSLLPLSHRPTSTVVLAWAGEPVFEGEYNISEAGAEIKIIAASGAQKRSAADQQQIEVVH